MSELRVLDLPWSPYEAGLCHGREAGDLIARNLELYFDRFQQEAQVIPDDVRQRAQRYLAVIADADPAYAETMRGTADGSELPLTDIAVLNARYELLYSQYSMINREQAAAHVPAGGCTAFAVTPEASDDGHLWLGQNWDWFPQIRGLIVRERRPDGFAVVAFTEAGIVGGKIGMNSAGLGLVINGLLSDRDDWTRLCTPFHVRTWRILHARALAEATREITDEERACSANFLLGQAGGQGAVVDIEAAPHAACTHTPSAGLLVHANHFIDPDALQVWQPLAEEKMSTYQRAARMQRLLEDGHRAGTLHAEGLMAVLRDHAGHPDSVCRHPNLRLPDQERVQTIVSVLEDLTARRMYVANGTPCQAPFQEIPVV